ncbi:hypothetical protein KY285_010602 [Solanum tuberosum]|nr:hypothetical protein KY285_010602 [Solanum tuberosum]
MDITCNVLEEDEQQITCDISHNQLNNQFTITFVYAKCKDHLRRPLWDRMMHYATNRTNSPWFSIGDFNVIRAIKEKLGGLPYNMRKSLEFIVVIEVCGLMDLGFNGQKFTWSNNRGINYRVWKRLDRGMVNDSWVEKIPHTTITHLPSVGSDHCPLLMEINAINDNHIKYFRSKTEERVRVAEENLIQNNTEENKITLHELNAGYIRFMNLEDSILKQKTQLQWFKEGDGNTKYFHSLIRGRRRKLYINKILREDGVWIQGEETIAKAACDHFQDIFTGENILINEEPLKCIPRMLNQEQNGNLIAMPNMKELKEVVFSMNPNSAAGPDSMNGCFFQKSWSIIKEYLMEVIKAFFSG